MSILRGEGTATFTTPCIECNQSVYLNTRIRPAGFGHLANADEMRDYLRDGTCGFCTTFLTTTEHMNKTTDWKP